MLEPGSGLLRPTRVGLLPVLAFVAVALLANELEHVPSYFMEPAFARALDLADPSSAAVSRRLAGEAAMAALMAAFVLAFTRRSAELIARPGRFLALLLAGATFGFAVVRAAATAMALPEARVRWQMVARDEVALLVWCTLFGWLFFLYLRRQADRSRLALTLMRRALLMRQLAQSRLGAARAQIEPEMIAAVLRTVKLHAATNRRVLEPARGAIDPVALIDHLANYLRLLLDRVRHGAPTLLSDLALVRSLVALREAETGIALELHVESHVVAFGERSAMATFLVVRAMLDAAVQCAPRAVRLALSAQEDRLRVQVLFAGADMAAGVRAQLATRLAQLQPNAAASHHHVESGMHCHEVLVPLA